MVDNGVTQMDRFEVVADLTDALGHVVETVTLCFCGKPDALTSADLLRYAADAGLSAYERRHATFRWRPAR